MIINQLHVDACRYGYKILPEEMPDDNKIIHLEKQIKDLSFKLKHKDIEISYLYDELIHLKRVLLEKI